MIKPSTFVAVCLLPCALFAQGLEVTTKTVDTITGFERVDVYNDVVIVEGIKDLKVISAAEIRVEAGAANVSVEASNKDREPTECKRLHEGVYLITQPGKHWVKVTAIDFDKRTYDTRTVVVTVSGKPVDPVDPTPGPTPKVPDDEFENIGRKIVKWASKIDDPTPVKTMFAEAVKEMENNPGATVGNSDSNPIKKVFTFHRDQLNEQQSALDKTIFEENARLYSADRDSWGNQKFYDFYKVVIRALEAVE